MLKTIFVLGAPRSGTTLLINMLAVNQSSIYGSISESQFYTTTLRQPYELSSYIGSYYWKSILSADEMKQIFSTSEDHKSFFRNAIRHCLKRENKNIFVEKSPMHTLFYKDIINDFENAEFMIINRNCCANIQSIAYTKWIPLASDNLPAVISKNKLVRYFFATFHFYKYWKVCREIEKNPLCKLSLQYEDIILEKIDMKEKLKEALGFTPDQLYVSRPFSDAVTHKNYTLDTSRVEDYKNKMPASVQYIINSIFNPVGLFQKLNGTLIRTLLFVPMNRLRKQN
jgi:hypothetical protein